MVAGNRKIMKTIIISGIDGSGKTSVINALQIELKNRGYTTSYIWLRFNHYLTKIMHAFARIIGLSVKIENEMGTVWQHRFYKSPLFCSIYIYATYIDTVISKVKYNRVSSNGSDLVICDRWIPDILVDLATKTHRENFLSSKWVSAFFKILPKNVFLFIVSRNESQVLDCRLENRIDPDYSLRNKLYNELMSKNNLQRIDNNGTIENSVNQIISSIQL